MPRKLPYQVSCHPSVPVHALGISQIIAYGFLFYAFAQLKIPLAERLGVNAVTFCWSHDIIACKWGAGAGGRVLV